MITLRFRFVKNFLSFFKLFEALFIRSFFERYRAALVDDLFRIPRPVRFVKNFFSFFKTFRPRFRRTFCVFPSRSREQLD